MKEKALIFRSCIFVLCSLLLSVAAAAAPVPDVKINGLDGPVVLTQSDTLTVSIAMNNGGVTANSDWWFMVVTASGVLMLDSSGKLGTAVVPAYQGPLTSFPPTTLLSIPLARIPSGTYTFYFAVDTTADGNLDGDAIYYDSATLIVAAPPLSLAGTWSGRGVDSNANTGANGATNVTWTLAQPDATSVSGTVTMQSVDTLGTTCSSCHRNKTGTLSGTITGTTLTLTISFPAGNPAGNPNDVTPICSASLTGTASGFTQDTLTAVYSGADSCEGPLVNGTLTMTRQPEPSARVLNAHLPPEMGAAPLIPIPSSMLGIRTTRHP
jgi:hypothetical protein